MADTSLQQSLRSLIREDFLTCSICFNGFNKPKALPCLHTFCLNCLEDYRKGFGAVVKLPCPICRQDCTLPTHGLKGLPDNYMVTNLVEVVEKKSSNNAVSPKSTTSVKQPVNTSIPISSSPRLSRALHIVHANGSSSSTTVKSIDSSSYTTLKYYDNQVNEKTASTPADNPGQVVTVAEDIPPSDAVGSLVSVASNISLNQGSPHLVNFGDTPIPSFGCNYRSNDIVEKGRSQGTYHSGGVLPTESACGKPCTHRMVLSFGKFGQTVEDIKQPYGLAVGNNGEFVISDKAGNMIHVYANNGKCMSHFQVECKVNDIAIAHDNLILLADCNSNSVTMYLYTMEGTLEQTVSSWVKSELMGGIVVTPSKHIAVTGLNVVLIYSEQMGFSNSFGGTGVGDNHSLSPKFISSTRSNYLVVSDSENHCVKLYDVNGYFKRSFGGQGIKSGQLNTPLGVATDRENFIVVADSGNFRVEIYTINCEFYMTLVRATNQIAPDVRPVNVAVTHKNNICVLFSGTGFCEVRVYHWKPLFCHGHTV